MRIITRLYPIFTFGVAALIFGCSSLPIAEEVHPAALFTDNMVLQRNMDIPIWGTATPLSQFKLQFRSQEILVDVDANGDWQVNLRSETAGGPNSLSIFATDTLVYKNVLVGEVWLGSGQSNMEMPLAGWGQVLDFENEIAMAQYPDIRLFTVPRSLDIDPMTTIASDGWKVCTPENIPEFSSTAYFFGRHLHQELDIPIGLIHSSWGGTPIEAWIGPEKLLATSKYGRMLKNLDKVRPDIEAAMAADPNTDRFEYLGQKFRKVLSEHDKGYGPEGPIWADPDLDDSEWSTMLLPSTWEERGYGALDGIGWFRKTVELSKKWQTGATTLFLSAVDDVDSTWFNGVFIGTDNVWDGVREYTIPSEIIRSGENLITVRVQDDQGGGGIWGDPQFLRLDNSALESLSLVGEWLFKVGLDYQELDVPTIMGPNPNFPTLLSNAMIEPVIPYAIRGVIWYQGESNAGRAYEYRSLMPMLIEDWRSRWAQGEFPFLIVQLANFMDRNTEPEEHSWAELREAQLMSLSVPNTGMAVAIDIGDANDIHPKNKQEVGRRLALGALGSVYERDIVFSSPIYSGYSIVDSKVRIKFQHVGEGLQTSDGKQPRRFSIAGADRVFKWAEAEILGDEVVVSHPDIQNPLAVRYAWAANPECTLQNSAGLPASPFRTDSWPGITEPSREAQQE